MYGLLVAICSNSDFVYANNDYLAKRLSITLYAVNKSLNALKNANLIRILNPNRYREIYINSFDPKPKVKKIEIDDKTNKMLDQLFNKL